MPLMSTRNPMEDSMPITRTVLSVLAAAVSVVILTLPASARQDAGRDAAIGKCVVAGQQTMGTSEEEMARRVSTWKACMTAEGGRP
jgi:hypothetical protein